MEHRERARHHRQLAREARLRYDPTAREVVQWQALDYELGMRLDPTVDPLRPQVRNPTERFLMQAWRHDQLAKAHEAAAFAHAKR